MKHNAKLVFVELVNKRYGNEKVDFELNPTC